MVRSTRVGKLDLPAKGPFQFLRYLNKDKVSAELINPARVEKRKIDGKTFVTAKTFRENTSNLALTKVNRNQFDISDEITFILRQESQKNYGNLF